MADFVKKKIIEKLARFTKDLKPADISLSFLSGKGVLRNLELDADFITEVLQLPPWLCVSRVVCDTIRAQVPFTSLRNDPLHITIGQVKIEVITCADEGPRKKHKDLMDKFGSNSPSKYGFTEKVIDGMRVEVRSIIVHFRDPMFQAQLEMTDILIQSTTPEWKPASLPLSRYKNTDEGSVIIYKMCTWTSLKLEGWSDIKSLEDNQVHPTHLRLISADAKVRVTIKRRIIDCSILHTRVSVYLGDVVWILSQSQLRAASRLVQSLMAAAVKTAQRKREEASKESTDGSAPPSPDLSERRKSKISHLPKQTSKSKRKQHERSKDPSPNERAYLQKISQYRQGMMNLPAYEIIQDSFHLKTGKIDLQLCDDTQAGADGSSVEGSMRIQLWDLRVDVYLDQRAMEGRHHWNSANDLILKNTVWSRRLADQASKVQNMDLPSVSLSKLRERGVVIRCSDFVVESLQRGLTRNKMALPMITCDKKTFCIPDDIHNPAFQVGVTIYYYPDECGNKFLVPRPNVYIYSSPIHVSLHQDSCLWLVEFVHGVTQTINMDLAASVHEEGKTFLEARKAQSVQTQQVPGVDAKFKILFTKVTIPLPGVADDGRPKTIQLETAAIEVKNHTLKSLLKSQPFTSALEGVKDGWVFSTQGTKQFPHFENDFNAFPVKLQELLKYHLRQSSACRMPTSPTIHSGHIATEGWHIHTSCVHLAFADSFTQEATFNAKSFVNDFPVHLWLFLPANDDHVPQSPSPGDNKPTFSFIVHTPETITAELERLQFLFLMRLKDSFAVFKETLMGFLTLPSIEQQVEEEKKEAASQTSSERVSLASTDESGSSSDRLKKGVAALSASVAGCIVVNSIQANILLPSLVPSQNKATKAATPDTIPEEEHLFPTVPSSGSLVVPSTTLPHSQLHSSSSHLSHSSSQASLTPSHTSQTSFTISQTSSNISGSLTSLPITMQSPGTIQVPTKRFSSTSNIPSMQRALNTHMRSLSASNILHTSVAEDSTESEGAVDSPISITVTAMQEHRAEVTTASAFTHGQSRMARLGVNSRESSPHSSSSELTASTKQEDVEEEYVMVSYDTKERRGKSWEKREKGWENQSQLAAGREMDVFPQQEKERCRGDESVAAVGGGGLSSQAPCEGLTDSQARVSKPEAPSEGLTDSQARVSKPEAPREGLTDSQAGEVPGRTEVSVDQLQVSQEETLIQLSQGSSSPSSSLRRDITSPSRRNHSSRRSSLALRRAKSPTPLRIVPQYILQVRTGQLCALPNILASDISLRVSVDWIKLCEIEKSAYEKSRNDSGRPLKENLQEHDKDFVPVIKARVELGKQVAARYFPDAPPEVDTIAMVKAEGIETSLLVQNAAVMKDFFDDEFEALIPVPLQIRVENIKVLLREALEHGPEAWSSMNLRIDSANICRGRKVEGINLFPDEAEEEEPGVVAEDVVSEVQKDEDQSSAELLQSFHSFIQVFETHVARHGQLNLQQPDRVAGLLSQLRSSLSDEEKSLSSPPSYSDATSGSQSQLQQQLQRLRQENKTLKQLEQEKEELTNELKRMQDIMENQTDEFYRVTEECKEAKVQLTTYKQVFERQQEMLEKLVTENSTLKR